MVTGSDTSVLYTQLVTMNGRQQNIIDGTGAQQLQTQYKFPKILVMRTQNSLEDLTEIIVLIV